MLLSQAVRRLRKPDRRRCRGPRSAAWRPLLKSARMADFSPEQLGLLTFGRGIDTARMRTELGFEPELHDRRGVRRLRRPRSATRRAPAERCRRRRRRVALEPCPPREPAVADAEIIPIGTGGRPAAAPAARGRRTPRAASPATLPEGARRPAAQDAAPRPRSRSTATRSRRPSVRRPTTDRGASQPRRASRPATGSRRSRPARVEVFGDDWEPQLAAVPGVPAPAADRRLRGRRVRLRPRGRRAAAARQPAADRAEVVPDRGARRREPPGRGRRAGRLQPLRHPAGRRPDDDADDPRPDRPLPAPARRRPGLPDAVGQRAWPARAAPRWPATRTPSGCSAGGELVGVWPEGFKGIGKPFTERYKLQRFGRGGFVAAAAADRRTDRAAVGRRRRGDLPADRQRPGARAAARHPLRPDHAAVPLARPARAGARCRRSG